jgi:hypothetical protein
MASDGNHDPDETKEAPVPAGLDQLSDAQRGLMELYGLSDSLIAAAAQDIPLLGKQPDPGKQHAEWLQGQSESIKDAWLAQWMSDPDSTVRTEVLAKFRKSRKAPVWPTVRRDRTIAELEATVDTIQQEANRKSAESAARARAKRLADMAADSARILRETEHLVQQRTTAAYGQIAKLLADLRESLAGRDQIDLAERQAQKLKKNNPTLARLTSELRREGFLRK